MKIVIFGLTITSSWGNGHATLWRGLCKALAKQGHEIVFFEPDVHAPAPPQPHYRAALSYLGTYAADRQRMLESTFVEPARQRLDQRFLIGGAQYPADFPWSDNIYFVRHLPPSEHAAFFSSSRLTLNVTRASMAENGWCPSGRLFEAAACGTAILSDPWPGLEEFFTPGSEILLTSGTDDTLAVMNMDDREIAQIGRAARERVFDQHTSDRRVREFERLLDS